MFEVHDGTMHRADVLRPWSALRFTVVHRWWCVHRWTAVNRHMSASS